MRITRAITATALGLAAAITPLSASAQNLADHTYSTADIEAGARVYVADCALCHGASGDGVDGVNLRLGRFRTARSDEDVRRVIATGVGSRMPAFDLSDAEANGVVAYIRAGFDPSGVAVHVGDPARGQAVFEGEGRCVGCHRVNGVGGRRLAPDLGEIGIVRTPAALQRTILDPTAALLPINRRFASSRARARRFVGADSTKTRTRSSSSTRKGGSAPS